jgi:hypothetical protein
MTENSLLIRSRRRAKALSCASEAAGDAADLLNAGREGNLGPAEALHLENAGLEGGCESGLSIL